MKFIEKLDAAVKKNNSLLCVGLDIDLKKIPQSFLNKPTRYSSSTRR